MPAFNWCEIFGHKWSKTTIVPPTVLVDFNAPPEGTNARVRVREIKYEEKNRSKYCLRCGVLVSFNR